jgi:hypothetical protein
LSQYLLRLGFDRPLFKSQRFCIENRTCQT